MNTMDLIYKISTWILCWMDDGSIIWIKASHSSGKRKLADRLSKWSVRGNSISVHIRYSSLKLHFCFFHYSFLPYDRMKENHAEMSVHENNEVTLRPLTFDGRVLVNGMPIEPQFETVLHPNDRLVFGATQMWLFRHPALETEAGVSDSPMINYDFVLHEMATKSGSTIFSSFSDNQGRHMAFTTILLNITCNVYKHY